MQEEGPGCQRKFSPKNFWWKEKEKHSSVCGYICHFTLVCVSSVLMYKELQCWDSKWTVSAFPRNLSLAHENCKLRTSNGTVLLQEDKSCTNLNNGTWRYLSFGAFISANWQQTNRKNMSQCQIYWSNLIGGALTLNLKADFSSRSAVEPLSLLSCPPTQ